MCCLAAGLKGNKKMTRRAYFLYALRVIRGQSETSQRRKKLKKLTKTCHSEKFWDSVSHFHHGDACVALRRASRIILDDS